MTCSEARELLSALIDDALGAGERDPLEAHLASCAECRRELERLRDTVALLHAVEPARTPAGFVDRVLEAARPASRLRRLLRALLLPWPVKLPLEAAAVVLVAIGVGYVYRATPELQQAARIESAPPPVAEAPRAAAPEPAQKLAEKKDAAAPSDVGGQDVQAPTALRDLSSDRERRQDAANVEKEADRQAEIAARSKSEASPAAPGGLFEKRQGPSAVVPAEPDPRAEAFQARRQTAPPSTSASFAPPDVSGRLAVSDRDATLRALSELVARLGGTEDRRLAGRDGPIVELTIPREVYVEFAFRLAQLGRWQPTRQPAELPARVRVVLTIQG